MRHSVAPRVRPLLQLGLPPTDRAALAEPEAMLYWLRWCAVAGQAISLWFAGGLLGLERPWMLLGGGVAILLRAGMVNSAATANLAASDLGLKPPVNEIDLLDWSQFERAVEIGYRYTR